MNPQLVTLIVIIVIIIIIFLLVQNTDQSHHRTKSPKSSAFSVKGCCPSDPHDDHEHHECDCPPGATGLTGATGPAGPPGATGATGASGTNAVINFADFYALMPGNNAATIAAGGFVDFPQDGPSSAGGLISGLTVDTFNLTNIGTYEVNFQVSVNEAGQLGLNLNGTLIPYTVAGRATGTSQIVGVSLITTTSVNSVLAVQNPAGNSTALTITPLAGGTHSVSANIIIKQIN